MNADLYICDRNGDVAQLARVLDWQSRGRGFEPHLLHKKTLKGNPPRFYFFMLFGAFKLNL